MSAYLLLDYDNSCGSYMFCFTSPSSRSLFHHFDCGVATRVLKMKDEMFSIILGNYISSKIEMGHKVITS
jgi:hypothetical protein